MHVIKQAIGLCDRVALVIHVLFHTGLRAVRGTRDVGKPGNTEVKNVILYPKHFLRQTQLLSRHSP